MLLYPPFTKVTFTHSSGPEHPDSTDLLQLLLSVAVVPSCVRLTQPPCKASLSYSSARHTVQNLAKSTFAQVVQC